MFAQHGGEELLLGWVDPVSGWVGTGFGFGVGWGGGRGGARGRRG